MTRLAAVGVLLIVPGLLAANAVRAEPPDAAASAPAEAKTCRVQIDRAKRNSRFKVERYEPAYGDCVCYVRTRSYPQSSATEAKINALLQLRQCPDAALVTTDPALGTGR